MKLQSVIKVLFVFVFLLQVWGIMVGPVSTAGEVAIPQLARLGGTFLLVAVAALYLAISKADTKNYSTYIFAGMFLGHLGDQAMAQNIPSPDSWLMGMVLFGIGHILYTIAFVRLLAQLKPLAQTGWVTWVITVMILSCTCLLLMAQDTDVDSAKQLGGLGYAIIISIMTGFALTCARYNQRLTLLALGAILFLISDLLLGLQLFGSAGGNLLNDFIWVIYISGQGLIVYSNQLVISLKERVLILR